MVILVGMGGKNDLEPFLVGGFVFYHFVGAFFASLVVVFFADNACLPIKSALSLVDRLGL